MIRKRPVMLAVGVGVWISAVSLFLAVDLAGGKDDTKRPGVFLNSSTINGYQFDYYLLHLKDRNTHHLMVYINGLKRESSKKNKVGFLVVGPDGSKQKMMAMGMKGAFGADMNFRKKGLYTVKTKALIGGKKLFDKFTYTIR